MKFSDMQLLRKMVGEGVTQQRVLEYFRKEGYSEGEVLDEIVTVERDFEQEKVIQAPVVDPTKPLPVAAKPEGRQFTGSDREEMRAMWSRGETESAIKAFFTMKGLPRDAVVFEFEDIRMQQQKGAPRVGVTVSYAQTAPKAEISRKKQELFTKPFVFSMIILIVLGVALVGLFVFAPGALDVDKWFSTKARGDYYIIVLPRTCGPAGAQLEVSLGEMRQILDKELFVNESNKSCGKIYLYSRTDANTVACPGAFEKNKTYTIVGDELRPAPFKCEDRNYT